MYLVTIRTAQNALVWQEWFPSEAEADKWIQQAQSKPNWINTYVVSKQNKTSDEQSGKDDAAASKAAYESAKSDAAAKLEGVGGLTLADINALFGTRLS